jgi:predicted Fe-S protein YdhL (DUF1289 family)
MMDCKGCGRKRSWPNFNVLSWHLPGQTEKSTEILSQVDQSMGRDLNQEPSDYEEGVYICMILKAS